MIIKGSRMIVADNSGANIVECIHVFGGSVVRWADVGDIINVVVKKAIPTAKATKASIQRAVIVRTKKPATRKGASNVKFGDNAVVLIDKKSEPIGSRVFGPIAREVRDLGFVKIASLAPEVL